MGDIKIFSSVSFGEVRVADINNEPYFCLADVCKVLELQTSRVKDRLDDDLTLSNPITDSLGRQQQATFVNEAGLYEVIMRSDKPEAKQFRKWVTSEVLPSIRKHGAYMTSEVIEKTLLSPDYLIQLATTLKDERQKRIEAETKVIEQQPKVAFANAIIGSTNSILVGAMAKILTQNGYKIGQNEFFKLLRSEGYLGSKGERYNIPNQEYVERGIFEIKENNHSENGVMKITLTPKITGKGQEYFINKFISSAV